MRHLLHHDAPYVIVLQAGTFPIPPSIRAVCALVVHREGDLTSDIKVEREQSRERSGIDWTPVEAMTILPGASTIRSTGQGAAILVLMNINKEKEADKVTSTVQDG